MMRFRLRWVLGLTLGLGCGSSNAPAGPIGDTGRADSTAVANCKAQGAKDLLACLEAADDKAAPDEAKVLQAHRAAFGKDAFCKVLVDASRTAKTLTQSQREAALASCQADAEGIVSQIIETQAAEVKRDETSHGLCYRAFDAAVAVAVNGESNEAKPAIAKLLDTMRADDATRSDVATKLDTDVPPLTIVHELGVVCLWNDARENVREIIGGAAVLNPTSFPVPPLEEVALAGTLLDKIQGAQVTLCQDLTAADGGDIGENEATKCAMGAVVLTEAVIRSTVVK
jgi:hypothetical protein